MAVALFPVIRAILMKRGAAMMYLECDNCYELIEREPIGDHVVRDLSDPESVLYYVTCDQCGTRKEIRRVHIDDFEFLGVDGDFRYDD
jgi:hypothetical protein